MTDKKNESQAGRDILSAIGMDTRVIPMTTIKLGERAYEVRALPSLPADKWRDEFEGHFVGIVDMLSAALSGQDKIEIEGGQQIAALMSEVKGKLFGSMRTVRGMLLSFSPVLKADEEYIGNTAFDVEIIDGLIEVLKLAYPLDRFAALFQRGRQATKTTPKSPQANGELTLVKRGRNS